ncbi:hypothetical protein DFA_03339 [Cavenderia fasciculata]|uniref:Cytochrome b5 heme-binding domain-containing protein n=1 Tax=Cavenderia fasciculata TaxID=261658 RepID=F4PHA9_CACFS|nr:uncharacterized protein DFA_03339 [Cavenderia fasciculata]EGG25093.1 hypothetical protein DFA_03339 [Cavenderia fasciculata]|eukprot:XP_004362944.1 hypothetical protein DFA_03339 [Cavenderia fasciculata]
MSVAGKIYSWAELSKHNTDTDCWVAVNGKVYDITNWINKHPGGRDVLLYAAGRDVTNLFESYHPFTEKPAQIIEKYQVGVLSSTEFPKYVSKSKFYDTLRERVGSYFKQTGQDPQGSIGLYTRMFSVNVAFIICYLVSLYTTTNFMLCVVMALITGFSQALMAMHTLHDASHSAVGHNPLMWKIYLGWFEFLTGSSYYAWIHQHVLGHHLYTNVRGADPDVGDGEIDFRIITPYQTRMWYHKYQHIYAPILYGLYAIKVRLQDWETMFKRINGNIRVSAPQRFDFAAWGLGKFSYLFFRIYLPLHYHSVASLAVYIVLCELVTGWYLTFNFQVSHIAEDLKFKATPSKNEEQIVVDEDWAVWQVLTTQDYSHGSLLATFLSGALNYQVVHHLFPSVSQDHLAQLVPIVKQVCQEYNIKYTILPSFYDAFVSHISYIYRMGNDPDYVKQPIHNNKKSN